MQKNQTRELAIYAALAAISAVFQIVHIGFHNEWGMWVDIVGVSWIIAFFLFGLRGGLVVSTVGMMIIALTAPDGFLGASMKFTATLPMFIVPGIMAAAIKKPLSEFSSGRYLIVPTIIAIIIRGIVMCLFNYYIAIPLWMPYLTVAEAMVKFSWTIIFGMNALQGIIEVVIAWVLVYKYRLSRFGNWSEEK